MGVAGLWDLIQHTSETRSLTHLAVIDGFERNASGLRGYRIGIDASIWFFHAKSGREGENPELRLIFFRLAKLLSEPFLPLFVFDGPKRPTWKRGVLISKKPHWMIHGVKVMIKAFGFEWRQAPGEAEAELAYLNRMNVIDGVISDDVDNFLFGARTVIRNPGRGLTGNLRNPALNSEGKDDGNHVRMFDAEKIENDENAGLTCAGFILIGLLSGGDYEERDLPGSKLNNCGIKTAHALAKAGFGDELVTAFQTLPQDQFASTYLPKWRDALREELRTNSRGLLIRKEKRLADSVPDEFPNLKVLKAYVQPVTSASEAVAHGRDPHADLPQLDKMWDREHNIASLARFCEEKFEWGTPKIIPKRFRSLLWDGVVIRILRRTALDMDRGMTIPGTRARSKEKPRRSSAGLDDETGDENEHLGPVIPVTPRKTKGRLQDVGGGGAIGTPSKLITTYLSSVSLNSPVKASSHNDRDEDDFEDHPLIAKIMSSTTSHANSDHILEYRVEIDPFQLVHLTQSGIKGDREEPALVSELSGGEDGELDDPNGATKKKTKQKPTTVDPYSLHRMWVPASMLAAVEVNLVRAFNEESAKRGKKVGKAKAKTKILPDSALPTKQAKLTQPQHPAQNRGTKSIARSRIPLRTSQSGPEDRLESFDLSAVPLTSDSDFDSDSPIPSTEAKSGTSRTNHFKSRHVPRFAQKQPASRAKSTSTTNNQPRGTIGGPKVSRTAHTASYPSESASKYGSSSDSKLKSVGSGPVKGKSLSQAVDDAFEWDNLFPSAPAKAAPLHPEYRPPSPPPISLISKRSTTSSSPATSTLPPTKQKRRLPITSPSVSDEHCRSETNVRQSSPKSPRKSKNQDSPHRGRAQMGNTLKHWKGLSSSESDLSACAADDRLASRSPSPSPQKGPRDMILGRASTSNQIRSSTQTSTSLLSANSPTKTSLPVTTNGCIIELVSSSSSSNSDSEDGKDSDDSLIHPSRLLAYSKSKSEPAVGAGKSSQVFKKHGTAAAKHKSASKLQAQQPLQLHVVKPGTSFAKKAPSSPIRITATNVIDLCSP